jgi:hypothetical protein
VRDAVPVLQAVRLEAAPRAAQPARGAREPGCHSLVAATAQEEETVNEELKAAVSAMNQDQLMEAVRLLVDRDPELARALMRDAIKRYPRIDIERQYPLP